MNLLYASYKNIGPFGDKIISVDFKKGKYLIKAPIGTGKSFLFFDGPLFALYKYQQRIILNTKSKEGFIKMIFEKDNEYYLIVRDIKQTKAGGDSVQSRFFKIQSDNIDLRIDKVINYNIDIISKLDNNILDEIEFKGNTELQSALEDLLPPKEVFLSTNFLLQESENIFELTPADRINVFKNIFGLLGIDLAKDKISEKRKDIQLLIKLKSDTNNYDDKLRFLTNKIGEKLQAVYNIDYGKIKIDKDIILQLFQDPFFSDIGIIKEKININNFSIINLSEEKFKNIIDQINLQKQEYFQIKTSIDEKISQTVQIQTDLNTNKNNILEIDNQIQKYEQEISSYDENAVKNIKLQKHEIMSNINILGNQFDKSIFEKNGYTVEDIFHMEKIIEEKMGEGKNLKLQLDNIEIQLENFNKEKLRLELLMKEYDFLEGTKSYSQLQDQINNKISKFKSEVENLKLKQNNLIDKKETITSIINKIALLEEAIKGEKTFLCDKISGNCPYIELIKNDSIKAIGNQKDILHKELEKVYVGGLDKLEIDYNDIEKQIDQVNFIIQDLPLNYGEYLNDFINNIKNEKVSIENQLKEIDAAILNGNFNVKKTQIEKEITQIKDFLGNVDWKGIKNACAQIKLLQNQIKGLDEQINNFEKIEQNIKSNKEKIISLSTEKESIGKQNNSLNQKLLDIENYIKSNSDRLLSYDLDLLNVVIGLLDELNNFVLKINELVSEFKTTQLQVNQLKEDEKAYSDLYNVFSKELMLVVLQQFLPSLEDAINNYLVQLVDYTLSFDLAKKANDKLELEIQVRDEKGNRPVKSLSGGQKTILKLIWILSVSSIMKTKFLFLDETINNLDYETIGRVAQVLQDFVNSSQMKFYVVTHSRQIQDMNIWDGVIDFS